MQEQEQKQKEITEIIIGECDSQNKTHCREEKISDNQYSDLLNTTLNSESTVEIEFISEDEKKIEDISIDQGMNTSITSYQINENELHDDLLTLFTTSSLEEVNVESNNNQFGYDVKVDDNDNGTAIVDVVADMNIALTLLGLITNWFELIW